MNGVIILLGARNDASGELSSIAAERCLLAADVYRRHSGFSVLPTGGFGNFNKTGKPHAYYTRRFLLELGVFANDILGPALSRSTFEDAVLSQPIVFRQGVKNLVVVTSDFHLERVELIFKRTFLGYNLSFFGSKTDLPQVELVALRQHEKEAIARLVRR